MRLLLAINRNDLHTFATFACDKSRWFKHVFIYTYLRIATTDLGRQSGRKLLILRYFTDKEECNFDEWMENMQNFYAKAGYSRKTMTDMSAKVNKKFFSTLDINNNGTIAINGAL